MLMQAEPFLAVHMLCTNDKAKRDKRGSARRVGGKRFENRVNSCGLDFFKNKFRITGGCCGFKFLRRMVNGKHFMRFQSENSVFKFLLGSMDDALVCR